MHFIVKGLQKAHWPDYGGRLMDADVDGRGTAMSITSWRPRSCVWTLKTLNLGRDLLSSPPSAVFSPLPADAGGFCRKTDDAPS